MNSDAATAKGWSTSSFGSAADTSALDVLDLSEHLDRCRRTMGAFFPALCLAQTVDSFLAPRVITTLAVVGVLAGAAFAVL